MSNNRVSVVVPTYRAAGFIEETLRSVFAQTKRPDEIVVVDDCSPDDTVAMVERIAATSPVPIRIIRLERNTGGPAKPLAVGFDAADGELIAPLDQDDAFLPCKIEAQSELLERHPNAAFAFAAAADMDDPAEPHRPNVFAELKEHSQNGLLSGDAVLRMLLWEGNFVWGFPGLMFRKSAWRSIGCLDERLRVGADYDFFCRLCLLGDVGFLDEVHYLRRFHDGNVTNDEIASLLDLFRVRVRYLNRLDPPFTKAEDEWIMKQGAALATAAREAGRFSAAWECLQLLVRHWGWTPKVGVWSMKLAAKWASKRVRVKTT